MGALGEVGGCQIALFGQARLDEVDCRVVEMIFHAKKGRFSAHAHNLTQVLAT